MLPLAEKFTRRLRWCRVAFTPPSSELDMRLRLTPRDTSYYDLFAELAVLAVTGVGLLSEVLDAPDKATRKDISSRFVEVEHAGDAAARAVTVRLSQTFVTPFDRDDIYGLANALDDVIDSMEEACDLIVLYKLDALPSRISEVIQVLQRCAELTADAMPRLRTMSELGDFWVEIHGLENRGDKLHRKLVAELFDEPDDPITVIKLKEIVDVLEEACDGFERVAVLVETIALKES
jgi:predicted phosphate transport protein (TIGR00153 family)